MKKYKIISNSTNNGVIIDFNGNIIEFSHEEAETLIDDIENEILNYTKFHEHLNKIKEDMKNGDKVELKIINVNDIKEKIKEYRRKLDFPMLYNSTIISAQLEILEEILNDKKE